VSTAINSRAEALKLARLLGLEGPESLAYAQQAPASELLDYRNAVTELLYDDDRALLQRMADAASLLPVHTLATVAERALGAPICARLTRPIRISQRRSRGSYRLTSSRKSRPSWIRAAPSMSSGRCRLTGRSRSPSQWPLTESTSQWVASLPTSAKLAACVETLTDEDLLRIAFVLEGKERLEELFELVGLERAQCMLDGAESIGLGEEALDLLDHLNARQRKQLLQRSRG
jgi:hypothetical protein